jgi:hypothetical protein
MAFAEAGRGVQAADADDGAVGPDEQPKATAPANPSSLTRQLMALQTPEATDGRVRREADTAFQVLWTRLVFLSA